MTIYAAKTPDDFRRKIRETGANSIVFQNGRCQSQIFLSEMSEENILKVFNDCVFRITSSWAKCQYPKTYIPLLFEAHKDGSAIVKGKWSVLSIAL